MPYCCVSVDKKKSHGKEPEEIQETFRKRVRQAGSKQVSREFTMPAIIMQTLAPCNLFVRCEFFPTTFELPVSNAERCGAVIDWIECMFVLLSLPAVRISSFCGRIQEISGNNLDHEAGDYTNLVQFYLLICPWCWYNRLQSLKAKVSFCSVNWRRSQTGRR